MRLNISDIPDDGLQQDLELPIVISSNSKPDTARVSIKVFKFGKKVLMEGSLKISVALDCSRCLKNFSYPVDTYFRDEFNPADDAEGEDEQELSAGELDLSFYRDDEIDIAELIKEQIMLSVPMKPLCSSDCHGICPKCGMDLNEGSCACSETETDPRFAPLRTFKKLMKEH